MIRKVIPTLLGAAWLTAGLMLACAGPPALGRTQGSTTRPGRAGERPAPTLPRTLVLGYEEFGPQAMSHGLIGFGWNQWKSGGHALPDDVAVKVVVYRGLRLGKVKAAYPVVRGRGDYRYVEYGRALRFLDRNIRELEEESGDGSDPESVRMWEGLVATLKKTRAAIIRGLR